MKYRRFEDLPVWQDATDLAVKVYEFTKAGPLQRHYGLRDQLERATLSISNKVAEGFERGTTNELLAFLYIARGSAGKIRSMFRVMERWKAFANFKSQISDLRTRSEQISKQFYGWIESLKNSEITGQRHLNDKRRASDTTKKDREEFLAKLHRITETATQERRDP